MRAPKAQVSARKRSGKRTAGSEGGLWRVMALLIGSGHPPKGCGARRQIASPISQVQGQRGGGKSGDIPIDPTSRMPRCISGFRHVPSPAAFFIGAAGCRGEVLGQTHTFIRPARRARRPHGRLRRLGHAGQLRLADRGAPRGAPRRRHLRRVTHVCDRRRAVPRVREFFSQAHRQRRRQAHYVRARRCTAACSTRPAASSTTSSSISSTRTGSASSSTPARATRTSPGCAASRRRSASSSPSARISPWSRCRARTRARRWPSCCRPNSRARRARARTSFVGTRARRLVRRAHRLHRRRRFRNHAAGRRGAACGAS